MRYIVLTREEEEGNRRWDVAGRMSWSALPYSNKDAAEQRVTGLIANGFKSENIIVSSVCDFEICEVAKIGEVRDG